MMKPEDKFEDFSNVTGLWIPEDVCDVSTLVQLVESAMEKNVSRISGMLNVTDKIWPWVEGKKIKILNRFKFAVDKDDLLDTVVSDLARDVMMANRAGADGAQIFVPITDLEKFVTEIKPIRDDLFFDKEFVIAIDLDDIKVDTWDSLLALLDIVHPRAVLFFAHGDDNKPKSDFVGRIYAMLEKWNLDSDLQFMFDNNLMRVQQTVRLVRKMRPDLADKITVFVRDLG